MNRAIEILIAALAGWIMLVLRRLRLAEKKVAEIKEEEKSAKIDSDIHALSDDELDERIRARLAKASKSDH